MCYNVKKTDKILFYFFDNYKNECYKIDNYLMVSFLLYKFNAETSLMGNGKDETKERRYKEKTATLQISLYWVRRGRRVQSRNRVFKTKNEKQR